ncbi:MAG TPA: transcriptional regulator [Actinophytocola sp.]|jgi:DNA-binding MarR family transcriptional regulator|nr:transcriptional regulator [Actinophytocola sp.]
MNHPRHRLDEALTSPIRLSIAAALSGVDSAQFKAVRDAVEISDSALSKQVTILEEAGYVRVFKDTVGRRPRTWLTLTEQGHAALRAHLQALRELTTTTLA